MIKTTTYGVGQQRYCVLNKRDSTKVTQNVLYTYAFTQVLQANSLKHAVQILGIRPEQLSLNDLEGNQVQKTIMMLLCIFFPLLIFLKPRLSYDLMFCVFFRYQCWWPSRTSAPVCFPGIPCTSGTAALPWHSSSTQMQLYCPLLAHFT